MTQVIGFFIKVVKADRPVSNAKVEIYCGGERVLEGKTSKEGLAKFSANRIISKMIDIYVNGRPVDSARVPKEHDKRFPELTIDLSKAAEPAKDGQHGHKPKAHAATAHGHAKAEAHHTKGHGHDEDEEGEEEDEEGEEEGILVIITDSHREPVEGAIVRIGKTEVYPADEDGIVVLPFTEEDIEVEVSAPGFKPKKVTVEPDDEKVKVKLDAQAVKTVRPTAGSVLGFVVLGVFFAALIYLLLQSPSAKGNLDLPSAMKTGISVITWLVLTGAICSIIAAMADRIYRQQFQDIRAAALALALFQIGGWNWFIGLVPEGLGQYGLQALFFIASLIVLYAFAWSGTVDMTTPGAFWLVNVALALIFGTFGPITDWLGADGKLYTLSSLLQGLDQGFDPKFTLLICGIALFAALHFVVDLSGLFVKGEDPAEKYGSLLISGLTVGAYYLVTGVGWLPPVATLIVVSGGAGLLSEFGKMGYGFFVPEADKAQTPAGKAILRTKWDGVALGITIILLVALFFGYV